MFKLVYILVMSNKDPRNINILWVSRTTGDEMVQWHHWLNGHKFEKALRVGDEQGSLVCCSPWGHKESDMTEQLNWTGMLEMKFNLFLHTNEKTGIKRLSEGWSKLMIEHAYTIMVLARHKFNVSVPLSFYHLLCAKDYCKNFFLELTNLVLTTTHLCLFYNLGIEKQFLKHT